MRWLPRLALISSGQSGGQQGSSSLVQIGVRPEEATTKPVPITAARARRRGFLLVGIGEGKFMSGFHQIERLRGAPFQERVVQATPGVGAPPLTPGQGTAPRVPRNSVGLKRSNGLEGSKPCGCTIPLESRTGLRDVWWPQQ